MFRDQRSQDEDRSPWYSLGETYEKKFCERIAPSLGLDAYINPEKAHNPKLPDLIVNGTLADLKVRTHPFFMAQEKYRIDPQYCIMFNRKDYEYYSRRFPNLLLYFWVKWEETERYIGGYTRRVMPMEGVWRASFKDVVKCADKGIFGQVKWGNGCDSFALDLMNFICLDINLN